MEDASAGRARIIGSAIGLFFGGVWSVLGARALSSSWRLLVADAGIVLTVVLIVRLWRAPRVQRTQSTGARTTFSDLIVGPQKTKRRVDEFIGTPFWLAGNGCAHARSGCRWPICRPAVHDRAPDDNRALPVNFRG